jgi:hypothetical protein
VAEFCGSKTASKLIAEVPMEVGCSVALFGRNRPAEDPTPWGVDRVTPKIELGAISRLMIFGFKVLAGIEDGRSFESVLFMGDILSSGLVSAQPHECDSLCNPRK